MFKKSRNSAPLPDIFSPLLLLLIIVDDDEEEVRRFSNAVNNVDDVSNAGGINDTSSDNVAISVDDDGGMAIHDDTYESYNIPSHMSVRTYI